ncbi:hypothetical protein EON83_17760 [bacterium]|nr:MAG: hypothetical protein EON83_17760 [bacterium]
MPDLVEQLRQLSELHTNGSLSDSEFERAKERLLSGNGAVENSAPSSASISLLALQNELAALDRQWSLERDNYRVRSRYGSSIPKQGDGQKAGTVIAIFGGVWTIGALTMAIAATKDGVPGPMALFIWIFPVFGVFFIVTGLSQGAEMNRKADSYQIAEATYKTKRAALEARILAHL